MQMLVSSISHEFNNPLSILLQNLEIAKAEHPGLHLEVCLSATHQIKMIVDSVIDSFNIIRR